MSEVVKTSVRDPFDLSAELDMWHEFTNVVIFQLSFYIYMNDGNQNAKFFIPKVKFHFWLIINRSKELRQFTI